MIIAEVWIAFAEATNIEELKRATRDETDDGKLMAYRISILKQNHLTLSQILEVI